MAEVGFWFLSTDDSSVANLVRDVVCLAVG